MVADFVPIISRRLTFSSTVMRVPLTLDIIVDQLVEPDETLSASLILEDRSLSSVIELTLMSTYITITDNRSEQHTSFKTKFTFHIYLDVM